MSFADELKGISRKVEQLETASWQQVDAEAEAAVKKSVAAGKAYAKAVFSQIQEAMRAAAALKAVELEIENWGDYLPEAEPAALDLDGGEIEYNSIDTVAHDAFVAELRGLLGEGFTFLVEPSQYDDPVKTTIKWSL